MATQDDPYIKVCGRFDHLQQSRIRVCPAGGRLLHWIVAHAAEEKPVGIPRSETGWSDADELAVIALNC